MSDAVAIVLRPDQQDYEGTHVTVSVARKLRVPKMMLVVNKTPAVFDAADVKQRVALPIALAAVGPLPAVAILVALGLVNVVTVAYMADALTRSATVRHGDAYIGRVVSELLGRPGALVLTTGVLGICLMGIDRASDRERR